MKIVNYNELIEKIKYKEKITDLINKYIIYSCLDVAANANFSTDYDDMKDHLFGSDDYIHLFLVEEKDNLPRIKGFLIAALETGYHDNRILHCHGIIIHPDVQSQGYSKKIIEKAISLTNPDIVTAKTHNPRCFNSFANLSGVKEYYPNESGNMPEEIITLAKSNPFISTVDDNLIYHDAYPDEKIQQTHRNQQLKIIFDCLGEKDAQAIISVLNDKKLELEPKVRKLTRNQYES